MTNQELQRLKEVARRDLAAFRRVMSAAGFGEESMLLAVEILILHGWRPPADTTATEGESDAG